MQKIVFFSIPAHGHINPTIELVRELVNRGNEVWYYSFNEFKEKIENAGAKFISCDEYLMKILKIYEKQLSEKISALFEMVLDMTIELEPKILKELEDISPDCIVYDSMSVWGKLFASKLDIPYVCSTTTFAFNEHTITGLRPNFKESYHLISSMGSINKKIKVLAQKGLDAKNFMSIFTNDNDTNTIVYTSKEFHPSTETFSNRYSFIGPSIPNIERKVKNKERKKIYISLGTVNNKNLKFYKNCISAFKDSDVDVVMPIGNNISIEELGEIPSNFKVRNRVNQIEELQDTDVFLTHSGMNSAHESLYHSVPVVLYPQQFEQKMVARRITDLGAGIILKRNHSNSIKEAVMKVMKDKKYKDEAVKISNSFKNSGGAKVAVDNILSIAKSKSISS